MLTLPCETERNAHVSYSSGALWWALVVRNRRVLTFCEKQRTKRTCQLHQRGVVVGPLFETGVCAHIWSLIVVDGAIIDVHSATLNVNASTL